ncbi:MAG: cytochrome c3 family protein [Pseudomonadota bacterium]
MEEKTKKRRVKRFLERIGVDLHLGPRFYKVLAITGVLVVAVMGYMVHYTTTPGFCNSCHIMKPYYDAWKTSKHKDVSCVVCHYSPETKEVLWAKFQAINSVVQYVTQKYSSKPYAQIDDASCLRSGCHSKNLLMSKRLTYKKGIRFDHKFHLGDLRRGKQLRCVSCHSQIVVGTHVEVTDTTCFLCHFRHKPEQKGVLPLGNCTTCHEFPQKEILFQGFRFNHMDFAGARHVACETCHTEVIQGEGSAHKEKCYQCHGEPERLAKYDDVTFMHEVHVAKRKVDCTRCHDEIKHGLKNSKVRFMEYNCNACHAETHSGPKEMFMGERGRGVPTTPSHMFTSRLDCLACHVQAKGAETGGGRNGRIFVASEKACTNCHGNQYRGMLKDWEDTFEVILKDIEPKLNAARQLLDKLDKGSKKVQAARKFYEDARYNTDFVRIGKGVHNPFYAAELIQVADRNLDRLFRMAGKAAPALPDKSPIKGGYCALLCHDKAEVKLPIVTSFQGVKLPHTRHAFEFGLGCTTCHSAEKHKEIGITKEGCMACHHSPENDQCARCHQEQSALFTAKNLPVKLPDAKPSVKSGKVECVNCHDLTKKQTTANIAPACVGCHDEAYKEILKVWKQETAESQKKTRDLLEKAGRKLNDARKVRWDVDQAAGLLDRGKKAYDFVVKANGVHNADLAGEILEQVRKDAQKAEELLASPGAKKGK